METTEKNYKAFIAGTRWSVPFDYAYGRTKSTAIAAVKRKKQPRLEGLLHLVCVCT